jgi:hypothetical protein
MRVRHCPRLWLGLAIALSLLATVPVNLADAIGVSVLRYADTTANATYTLKLVKSCEVGDGLAIVKNVGAVPLRLTSIAVLYGDGASARQASTTFQLVSLRRGTSEGQLEATFDLAIVDGGDNMGNAVGGVVEPISKSGRSYEIVAKVLVIGDHAQPWTITGLRITYKVGSRSYATVLAQSITLSSTPSC